MRSGKAGEMDELKSERGKMIKNVNFNSISLAKNRKEAAANKTSSCKVVYCEPGAARTPAGRRTKTRQTLPLGKASRQRYRRHSRLKAKKYEKSGECGEKLIK